MRDGDKTLVLVSVVFSGIISLVISNLLLGGAEHKTVVETMEPLSSVFSEPDPKHFNSSSLNPTREIRIGDDIDGLPFEEPAPEPIPVVEPTEPAQ